MSAKGKKPLILVVDDNKRNVKLLVSILTPKGYEIASAYNGREALDSVREISPDLILLDVLMPEMDGFEVARVLRSQPETRAIPILMLTALRDMQDKIKGLEAGADDFLSKPFNAIELLVRVRALLRIKQLHDELEIKNNLLENVLTHYVSKEIAAEILSDPEQKLQLGGKSCNVSVLFADIRGFTHFSEQHKASQVTLVLNHIFNNLVPPIYENSGTLDKYLGDAIMAFYGAPLPSPNTAEQAVRTAVTMQKRFSELLSSGDQLLLSTLGLGVGICTGEAVVGNIGSEDLMDYTVIGNTPNIAKRLQEHAKPGQILIDAQTYQAVKELVEVEPTEPLHLKGRSDLVSAYDVLSVKDAEVDV
ncbi:MAG: response regulator [Anaerolineae bacterium]|nr:response regulator [Anaerolineae bacterium]